MPSNEYHFITHWRVEGTINEVANILKAAEELPRWWPSVYLEVKVLESGDENGIGKVVSLHTRGWLPYSLRWQFRVTESRYPHGFSLEAWGDFNGRGIWILEQDAEFAKVTYDWKIRAEKPLLRVLSFLLKPLFSANHRWAMSRGEESLEGELARIRALTKRAPEFKR
ncbi:MAG: polyketide cyclase [Blastocatellia bacterium]